MSTDWTGDITYLNRLYITFLLVIVYRFIFCCCLSYVLMRVLIVPTNPRLWQSSYLQAWFGKKAWLDVRGKQHPYEQMLKNAVFSLVLLLCWRCRKDQRIGPGPLMSISFDPKCLLLSVLLYVLEIQLKTREIGPEPMIVISLPRANMATQIPVLLVFFLLTVFQISI